MEEIRVVVDDIGAMIAIGMAYNWWTTLKTCASSLASAARDVVRAGVIVSSLTS